MTKLEVFQLLHMMASTYDGSLSLPRKLTEEEIKELRISLLPYFHLSGNSDELSPEDISDFLDYAFAMISNSKTVGYVIQELMGNLLGFLLIVLVVHALKLLLGLENLKVQMMLIQE